MKKTIKALLVLPLALLLFVLPFSALAASPITQISIDRSYIFVGDSRTIEMTVYPADAVYENLQLTLKDPGTTGATLTEDVLHTTAPGTLVLTATAEDYSGDTMVEYTQDFSIDAAHLLSVPKPLLPNGRVGEVYSHEIEVTGAPPFTWSFSAHSLAPLPDGLEISSDGRITGTPTASGKFRFSLDVSDLYANKNTTFTIVIEDPLPPETESDPPAGGIYSFMQRFPADNQPLDPEIADDALFYSADGVFQDVTGLLIDGVSVPLDENLVFDGGQITEGSVLVRLNHAYISKLADGQHSIEVTFAGGSAKANFTVERFGRKSVGEAPKPAAPAASPTTATTRTPATDDGASFGLWIALLAVSAIGMTAVAKRNRAKQSK